jgi:hypothetical protein
MAEWMDIQQSNTQYCANHRTKIINTALGYNSGNGSFARLPTLLKTFKRALQEMLGCDRWYGAMPKGCVIAWVMETTDREEIIATEEMKAKEKKRKKRKEKENKRKSRKERKRMRNYVDALRPRQLPIAKPNTKITSKRPNTTSRNAHATQNNTTPSNALALTTTGTTSRRRLTTSASDCTRGANQPGH